MGLREKLQKRLRTALLSGRTVPLLKDYTDPDAASQEEERIKKAAKNLLSAASRQCGPWGDTSWQKAGDNAMANEFKAEQKIRANKKHPVEMPVRTEEDKVARVHNNGSRLK